MCIISLFWCQFYHKAQTGVIINLFLQLSVLEDKLVLPHLAFIFFIWHVIIVHSYRAQCSNHGMECSSTPWFHLYDEHICHLNFSSESFQYPVLLTKHTLNGKHHINFIQIIIMHCFPNLSQKVALMEKSCH